MGKTGFWGQTRLGLSLGAAVLWPGDLSKPTCLHLQNVANNAPVLQDCGESQMQRMHVKCLVLLCSSLLRKEGL